MTLIRVTEDDLLGAALKPPAMAAVGTGRATGVSATTTPAAMIAANATTGFSGASSISSDAAFAAALAALHQRAAAAGGSEDGRGNVGLVIDGSALALALAPPHEEALLQLCRRCNAVLCCRVSPMQKAQVCVCTLCIILGSVCVRVCCQC